MIAQSIHEIIHVNPSTPVSTIIAHIKSSLGYTFTCNKVCLGKQLAIEKVYGKWGKSYQKLSALLNAMQLYVPGLI